MPKSIPVKIIFLLALLNQCDTNKEVDVCGCTGKKDGTQSIARGVLAETNAGIYFISEELGMLSSCDSAIDTIREGTIYVIKGSTIADCASLNLKLIESHYFDYLNVTEDSAAFSTGDYVVKIIRSEDYGYPQGYGYVIDFRQGTFTLLQPTIPGVEGFVPFKTRGDALKIAVLLVHRMYHNIWPTVFEEDLTFFKIVQGS